MAAGDHLHYFFRAWLHQDCDHAYGSIAGAADDFIGRGGPMADVDALADELEAFLAGCTSDRRLIEQARRLGAGYTPLRKGVLRRELQDALTRLRAAAAAAAGSHGTPSRIVRWDDGRSSGVYAAGE